MKVFIAATLKPVNDPRLYEKIGKTLAKKGGHTVVISGYDAKLSISAAKKVKFYPLFKFKRLSLERVWAPLKIIPLVLKEKPNILIVASHELLVVAVLIKLISKITIVYDIQENYLYNIWYHKTFPPILRTALGLFVRLKEKLTASFFDGFILAERIYNKQLDFLNNKFYILENKFQSPYTNQILPKKELDFDLFIYTGTVSEEYGISEAISYVKALRAVRPEARLKILGFSPTIELKRKLDQTLRREKFIEADIRSSPVPYPEIHNLLSKGGVLLLPYKYSRAIVGKVPTRFYEGKALGLPMIVSKDLDLNKVVPIPAGVFLLDFENPDIAAVKYWLDGMQERTIIPDKEALWESQEDEFLEWINRL